MSPLPHILSDFFASFPRTDFLIMRLMIIITIMTTLIVKITLTLTKTIIIIIIIIIIKIIIITITIIAIIKKERSKQFLSTYIFRLNSNF